MTSGASRKSSLLVPNKEGLFGDLQQALSEFNNVILQKHTIDKLKSVGSQSFIQQAAENCLLKIQKGIGVVEFLMIERLWFLSQMQKDEEDILRQVYALRKLSTGLDIEDLNVESSTAKLNQLSASLSHFQENFQRASRSLLSLDKGFMYTEDWRDKVQRDYSNNRFLKETMVQTLKQAAQNLYLFFKKKKNTFRTMIELKENEGFAESQIMEIIEFMEYFCYELNEMVPLKVKVLCYLWIEDMIQLQARYEENLALESAFCTNYFGAHNQIVLAVQKMNRSVHSLQKENADILRQLKHIVMPSTRMAANFDVQQQCAQRIHKCRHNYLALINDSYELCRSTFKVRFLTISKEFTLPGETAPLPDLDVDLIDGKYQGALILFNEEVNILQQFRQQEVKRLRERLINIQSEEEGIQILINKVNDLWAVDKKFRKAQGYYQVVVNQMTPVVVLLGQDPENNQQLQLQILNQSSDLVNGSMLLQKYANWLSYFLTSMQALLIFLPHISEYIVQVEKFLGRCQLVLEQLASEILNRVYKLFISYRVTNPGYLFGKGVKKLKTIQSNTQKSSATKLSKHKSKEHPLPSPHNQVIQEQAEDKAEDDEEEEDQLDSDEEFDALLEYQAFGQRTDNANAPSDLLFQPYSNLQDVQDTPLLEPDMQPIDA